MTGNALLDIRGLRKAWPGLPAPVLAGVSLSMPGCALVLVEGANGAGKTTLLRTVAGLLSPDGGELRVCGIAPDADRRRYQREIGLAAAGNSGLYARLSARHHLSLAARLGLVERRMQRRLIEQAIDRFAMAEYVDRRVDRLSMGQRQRVRLSMAFLHEPAVVLLDEPLTSLDRAGHEILSEVIAEHRASGRSVLWCGPTGESAAATPDLHLHLDHGMLRVA